MYIFITFIHLFNTCDTSSPLSVYVSPTSIFLPLPSLHFDSCNDFSGLLAFQHHMINSKIISFCYVCLFESSKIATAVKADKWPRWMAVPLPGSGRVTDGARATRWDVDMEVSAEHSPGAQSQCHKTIWNQLLHTVAFIYLYLLDDTVYCSH